MTWDADEWDHCCTRCHALLNWRGDPPESEEDAICDDCAMEELRQLRCELRNVEATVEALVKRTPQEPRPTSCPKCQEALDVAKAFMQSTAEGPSNEMAIQAVIACGRCLKEVNEAQAGGESISNQSYSRITVGFTPEGLQVWCARHDMNILHIDFQGHQLPANTTA